MAILVAPDSAAAIEQRKWEAQHTPAGPPGRPYEYRPYPAMLYKAGRINNGPLGIIDSIIVADEQEAANMKSRGYFVGPAEAVAGKEAEQLEHAKLAAELEYEKKKKLSEKAVVEVEAVQNVQGSEHLPGVPETPIVRHQPASAATLAKQRMNQAAKNADPNDGGI